MDSNNVKLLSNRTIVIHSGTNVLLGKIHWYTGERLVPVIIEKGKFNQIIESSKLYLLNNK